MLKLWIYDRVMKCYIAVANQQYVITLSKCLEVRKFREMRELWNYDKLWCIIILITTVNHPGLRPSDKCIN